MREYELVIVVSPEGGEEDFPATVDRVHGLIKERGGEVKNVDRWGRRRLAYPVDRFTEGYYSITQFTLDPQDVRELESGIEVADDVLRHLVVRMDEPIVVRPELDPDAPFPAPVETPAEGAETPSAEASAADSAEPPAEDTTEAPADEPAEAPPEAPAEAPSEATAETSAEAPGQGPPEAPAEEPAEKPAEAVDED